MEAVKKRGRRGRGRRCGRFRRLGRNRGFGGSGGRRQRGLHRLLHEGVDAARIPEAHFGLRRMHVDVDFRGGNRQEKAVGGLQLSVKHVLISRTHGVREDAVAHEPAVDEKVLRVGLRLRGGGESHDPHQAHRSGLHVDDAVVHFETARQNLQRTAFQVGRGREVQHLPPVVPKPEAHLRVRKRDAAHLIRDVRGFGGFALHEFAPGGRLVEEVPHLDAGAPRRAGRGGDFTTLNLPRARRAFGETLHRHRRHRVDRRQRLAPETETRHVFEFEKVANLARGVALQGEPQLFLWDPAAVVGHEDALQAPALDADLDRGGPCVDGVLHQFLHDGRRPLDHFARGDLADELRGELLNFPARCALFHSDFLKGTWGHVYGCAKSHSPQGDGVTAKRLDHLLEVVRRSRTDFKHTPLPTSIPSAYALRMSPSVEGIMRHTSLMTVLRSNHPDIKDTPSVRDELLRKVKFSHRSSAMIENFKSNRTC